MHLSPFFSENRLHRSMIGLASYLQKDCDTSVCRLCLKMSRRLQPSFFGQLLLSNEWTTGPQFLYLRVLEI